MLARTVEFPNRVKFKDVVRIAWISFPAIVALVPVSDISGERYSFSLQCVGGLIRGTGQVDRLRHDPKPAVGCSGDGGKRNAVRMRSFNRVSRDAHVQLSVLAATIYLVNSFVREYGSRFQLSNRAVT